MPTPPESTLIGISQQVYSYLKKRAWIGNAHLTNLEDYLKFDVRYSTD